MLRKKAQKEVVPLLTNAQVVTAQNEKETLELVLNQLKSLLGLREELESVREIIVKECSV